MTVIELIERRARLTEAGVSFGHGTTNAFDEAAWLVLWRLGLPLDALDDVARRPVRPRARRPWTLLLDAAHQHPQARRLPDRRGLAAGRALLRGRTRAIVPRSLIAEPLADGSIDAWLGDRHAPRAGPVHRQRQPGRAGRAGLARRAVDAADLSADALAVARINVDRHGLADRITLLQGDGLAAVAGPLRPDPVQPALRQPQSMAPCRAEYRAEPALALAGGADGMDFIRPCCARPAAHLNARTACWCWRSATNAPTSKPPSRAGSRSGWTPAPATTRCCC
jgi:ribosomal protein L3 glutamine methyltransferase